MGHDLCNRETRIRDIAVTHLHQVPSKEFPQATASKINYHFHVQRVLDSKFLRARGVKKQNRPAQLNRGFAFPLAKPTNCLDTTALQREQSPGRHLMGASRWDVCKTSGTQVSPSAILPNYSDYFLPTKLALRTSISEPHFPG